MSDMSLFNKLDEETAYQAGRFVIRKIAGLNSSKKKEHICFICNKTVEYANIIVLEKRGVCWVKTCSEKCATIAMFQRL